MREAPADYLEGDWHLAEVLVQDAGGRRAALRARPLGEGDRLLTIALDGRFFAG